MYIPTVKCNSLNSMPILSRSDIDFMAEKFLKDFQPEALKVPMAIDIDGFVENYLGANPDYKYLSHNMIYLGMTVFDDTNSVIIYNPSTERAEYISEKAKTVIIDSRLLNENQEHRYRFSLGHESGHIIFHKAYFARQKKLSELFGVSATPYVQCCKPDSIYGKRKLESDSDWLEWQANQFSSSLLMPVTAVKRMSRDFDMDSYYEINNMLCEMESVFNVSFEAATNRLNTLEMINKPVAAFDFITI